MTALKKVLRSRATGASLVELLICMALLSVVFAGVTMILIRGLRFYRIHTGMQEAQRQAMMTLLTLTADLQNTRSTVLFFNPSGVSFADPYNDNNLFEFDTTVNPPLLYWHAYRTYYIDGREFRYIRSKYPKTTNPAAPNLATPAITPDGYVGTRSGKLLLEDVAKFSIVQRLKDSSKNELQDLYIINVEVGRKGDPDWFWLNLTTATSPRNDKN